VTGFKFRFVWIPQEKKFHLEFSHAPSKASVFCWASPEDAVAIYNTVLGELRQSALDPSQLPGPLRRTDSPPTEDGELTHKVMLMPLQGGDVEN
jgi:hypothetical protein